MEKEQKVLEGKFPVEAVPPRSNKSLKASQQKNLQAIPTHQNTNLEAR